MWSIYSECSDVSTGCQPYWKNHIKHRIFGSKNSRLGSRDLTSKLNLLGCFEFFLWKSEFSYLGCKMLIFWGFRAAVEPLKNLLKKYFLKTKTCNPRSYSFIFGGGNHPFTPPPRTSLPHCAVKNKDNLETHCHD